MIRSCARTGCCGSWRSRRSSSSTSTTRSHRCSRPDCGARVAGSDLQFVCRVELLVRDQDVVYGVRVRRLAGELVMQHLEDMLEPVRIVDVDVSHPVGTVGEEGELQIAVVILRLEAAGVGEARGLMVE